MKRGKGRNKNDGDEYSFVTKERDKQINERGACVNDTVSESYSREARRARTYERRIF